jgi:cytochrome b subunit of formate dehydrogenase
LGIPLDLEIWRMAVYILVVGFIFHILAFISVTFMYTNYHKELANEFRAWKKERHEQKHGKQSDASELIPQ